MGWEEKMAYYHEENKAEKLLRREMARRGLHFRQGAMIAGREIDFYLPECFLAVEVDGFSHLAADVRRRDADKERLLSEQGITLLRFGNEEVFADVRACVDRIVAYVKTWREKVAAAEATPGESPFQRQLSAWAARAGLDLVKKDKEGE
ncbi:MAG: endonuclease domain-containing protein [Bacillota bacterium]